MSSARIPSFSQLRWIWVRATQYAEVTRRLLGRYPGGRAPHRSTDPRGYAMTRLKAALIRGESSAPCGWSEDVCAALEEMTRRVEDFESWSGPPSIDLDEPPPDDQWDPREEEAVLARWDELISLLGRTLLPPARPSADP